LTQLGELSLWIALLMAAWCTTLATQGALTRREPLTESGARGLHASFFFAALAQTGLVAAFVGDDFSLRYVALHSNENVETFYKICAAWAGPSGELLLASLLTTLAGSVAVRVAVRHDADRVRAAWTVALLGVVSAAMLAWTVFQANPFTRLPRAPQDGRGLEPILHHPAMMIQQPLMLLGAALAVAPICMALAAFVRRNSDRALFTRIRGLAVAAFALLSVSFIVGARWMYVSPGLRAFRLASPAVVACVGIWMMLTTFLAVVEIRAASREAHSEADLLRVRAGRVLAGIGALLLIVGVVAGTGTRDYDAQISDGGRYEAKDAWGHAWVFTSQGASRLERQGNDVIALGLLPTRDGVRQPFVTAESREYYTAGGLNVYPAQAVPGIRSTLAQDLFVVLSDINDERAVLRISFRPLVELVWAGSVLLAVGGLLLFWPPRPEHST
jgi:cytochrome c biogenesis factor